MSAFAGFDDLEEHIGMSSRKAAAKTNLWNVDAGDKELEMFHDCERAQRQRGNQATGIRLLGRYLL